MRVGAEDYNTGKMKERPTPNLAHNHRSKSGKPSTMKGEISDAAGAYNCQNSKTEILF